MRRESRQLKTALAAEQGLVSAQYSLGWMYERGRGVESNIKDAIVWYRKASDQGLAEATLRLVVIHEDGLGIDKNAAEAKRLTDRAKKQLGEDAEDRIRCVGLEMNPLNRKAPNAQGEIGGKKFNLADSSGKVAVVAFTASWCPHCRDIIPHQQQLAKRLKDAPFTMLDVDIDKNEALASRWRVTQVPTIYVIDHRGIIRFTGSRGKELESAVDTLLKDRSKEKSK